MCPENRGLNKMMKEAFDREEKARAQVRAAGYIPSSRQRVLGDRALARCQSVCQRTRLAERFDKVATTLTVVGGALGP